MTVLLEFLAQNAGTIIGVGPLPVLNQAESSIDVKVVELAIGLGHREGEFDCLIFAGADLDLVQEKATNAATLQIWIDSELGEVGDLWPEEERRERDLLDLFKKDDADDLVGIAGFRRRAVDECEPTFRVLGTIGSDVITLATGKGFQPHLYLRLVGTVEQLGDFRDGIVRADGAKSHDGPRHAGGDLDGCGSGRGRRR